MFELLSLSIGLGLVTGLIFTEVFGIACGGLVVPGYMALYLNQPIHVLVTLGISFATFLIVRMMSMFLIVYGRRRTALMILIGYLLGMLVREYSWALADGGAYIIGFIIPGLIAIWMDRQGVMQTIASLLTVSVVVRLILIILVGTEKLT